MGCRKHYEVDLVSDSKEKKKKNELFFCVPYNGNNLLKKKFHSFPHGLRIYNSQEILNKTHQNSNTTIFPGAAGVVKVREAGTGIGEKLSNPILVYCIYFRAVALAKVQNRLFSSSIAID